MKTKTALVVEIYMLDEDANDVKAGEVRFDGKRITTTGRQPLMTNIAKEPIWLAGGVEVWANQESERFMRNLCWHYRGAYLRASKAVQL